MLFSTLRPTFCYNYSSRMSHFHMYLRYKSPFRLSSLLCSIEDAAADANDGGLGSLQTKKIQKELNFNFFFLSNIIDNCHGNDC